MSRLVGLKAWPLVIGGLIAVTALARYSGTRRRGAQDAEEVRSGI